LLRLCAYTGARIGELAQLRRDDVGVSGTVPFLSIGEGDGQSVKNAASVRRIPLHKEVADFVEYAKASNKEFLFASFPDSPGHGRQFWLINNFSDFLREECAIDDRRLT